MWYVEVAEYMGDGYWADYPPIEFKTEAAARDYVKLVGAQTKVRCVYFR